MPLVANRSCAQPAKPEMRLRADDLLFLRVVLDAAKTHATSCSPCSSGATNTARSVCPTALEVQCRFPFGLDSEFPNPAFDVVTIELVLHRRQNARHVATLSL